MEDQAHLEPGFDPATFTVPQLRRVLLEHNVNYPSSAKKSELIGLFNENVASQARKLKAASVRVKRSSRGIVDIPASQNSAYDDEEEDIPPPPPRSTSRKSGGRSTRARTEEAQEIAPEPRRSRHSTAPPEAATPRRVSSKHGRTVEKVEEEPESKRPASRRSKQSATTPVVKSEDEDTSNFSKENVFQTGSSPPVVSTDHRRTTMSATKDVERRRSEKVRRRTEEIKPARQQRDGAVVPTRRTFEMPASAMKKDEEMMVASEEFTPEEAQELVRAQQAGELVPARPTVRRPASKAARNGFGAIGAAMLVGLAGLWGQEKFQVGYCGVGRHSTEVAGVEVPQWADTIRPTCEPCPPHAICGDNLETTCETDFVLTHHPLSLNGVLPFPPKCEPDSAKARRVNIAKEQVLEVLRKQNAKYECGEASTPEIQQDELKNAFKQKAQSTKRQKRMSNEDFEDLWNSAIGEVQDAEEVSTGTDGSGHTSLRSTSHLRLTLSCAIRRHLRETLRRYFWQLVALLLAASGTTYTRYRITSGRETEKRAKALAGLALEKLSYQAALHASQPEVYTEGYLPMAQLRDDVLRKEFSSFRRKKLWEQVQRKVERNSNVRPMVREGRSGDVGRVWEWVGAVGMLESGGGSSPPETNGGYGRGRDERRKSGRVSFGGERWIEDSPREEGGDGRREVGRVGKWEEGRAYY